MIRPGECIYMVESSDNCIMRPCRMANGKKCCYYGLKCQFEEKIPSFKNRGGLKCQLKSSMK